jgi:putative transposase
MPRIKRITKGGIAYHVLNRANGRLGIFKKDLDFVAFENILAEGIELFGMRLCGYCIMSNHWHMLLWPDSDDAMPAFMHWVTLTHTQRWHKAHGTTGIGHLYQGRYKSFPVQSSGHYLKTMRYIEANPLHAGMVESAADWNWSSFAYRKNGAKPFKRHPGPVPLPRNWADLVGQVMPEKDAGQIANCIKRGCPYGQKEWINKTAEQLNLQSTMRKRGRPRKYPEES